MIFTKDNLSITFTAYNCLSYLKLAIYSFLEFYPQLKEAIIVFDDDSTDGTIEWLAEENIRRITWSQYKHIRNVQTYMKVYKHITSDPNISLRNSYMMDDMLRQIQTTYAMVNDSDILFLREGFMEEYSEIMKNTDNKLCIIKEQYNYGWNINTTFPLEMIQRFLGKYFILYNYSPESMTRFHLCFSLFDLKYLKQRGIIFDNVSDNSFVQNVLRGAILDTGSSFTRQIFEKDIPFYQIEEKVFNSVSQLLTDVRYPKYYVYHFRWKSSYEQTGNMFPDRDRKHNYYLKSDEDLLSCNKLRKRVLDVCSEHSIQGKEYVLKNDSIFRSK